MEEFDIEDIDFNEYNRRVYEEEDEDNFSINKMSRKIYQASDAQRKYKEEIKKFVDEYNRLMALKDQENLNNEQAKKRKI